MQRELGVRAGKAVGSGLSTTFTPMSHWITDLPWITDRPPTEADGDRDGDVAVKQRPASDSFAYLNWTFVKPGMAWRRTSYRVASEPAPSEPVDAEFTPPAAEIPEPIRNGLTPFYVVVASDDSGRGSGGNPIIWETQIPEGSSLTAVLQQQSRVLRRDYGTIFIAECRIIPELTRR